MQRMAQVSLPAPNQHEPALFKKRHVTMGSGPVQLPGLNPALPRRPAVGVTPNLGTAVTGTLEAILELSGASRVVEACHRLASVLESVSVPPPQDLPEGIRPNLHRLIAVLTFPTWEEVIRWAAVLDIDLRDLVEAEVAYAERVTIKTAQRWRSDGDGPPYRNEAGIRYPVSWYWEWRRKGRQSTTAQRATRGRRSAL